MIQRTVVITGSSRGIGYAVAKLFLEHGHRVVLTARNTAALQAAADELRKKYGDDRVLSVRTDVGEPGSVSALFTEIDRTWGIADVLVNNAAIGYGLDFYQVTQSAFDEMFAVNVRGTFFCSQEFMKRLAAGGKPGSIVNLSSLGGIQGTEKFKGLSVYTATKFAVVGITEALAVEGRDQNIRVNCVAPGAVDTEMLRKAAPQLRTNTRPEDVAQVVYDLYLEAESQGTTGKVVEIHSNIQ